MDTFSKRYGYKPQNILRRDEMSESLKNRIFNLVIRIAEVLRKMSEDEETRFIESVWDRVFKLPIIELRSNFVISINYLTGEIDYKTDEAMKYGFDKLKWYEIYDLIEFIFKNYDYLRSIIKKVLNKIFEEENAPYQITDEGKIELKFSTEEQEEINKSFSITSERYKLVYSHLEKAKTFFNQRPEPDYKNSIAESIKALEALARIVTNEENDTLGDLCDLLPMHPAFREGLKKIYGWASDEGGIRHSEKQYQDKKFESGENEAKFMLVLVVSFINYIISKFENEKQS